MTARINNTPATNKSKLPLLKELRRMAREAGVPAREVSALIPEDRRPTNKQKRALMQLIEEYRAKAPQAVKGAASKAKTRRKPTRKQPASKQPKAQPTSEQTMTPSKAAGPATKVERRRVEDLRPNKVNGKVFGASLSDEGIEALIEDIRRRGQRSPVEIGPDGTIHDGERRWRATKALGYTHIDVVVRDAKEEEVEDCVFDSHSTQRDTNVEEKVNLFALGRKVLQRRHGRPAGRPSKPAQICAGLWEPTRIKTEAAKRAGFQSVRIAEYATRIFCDGDDDTKAEVNAGALAISAAYARVRKPSGALASAPAANTTASNGPVTTSSSPRVGPETASADRTARPPLAIVAGEGDKTPEAPVPSTPSVDGAVTHPSPNQPGQRGRAVNSHAHRDAVEGTDTKAEADGLDEDSPPASTDGAEIDLRTAWTRVLVAAEEDGLAARLAHELLDGADVRHWICPEEPDDYLTGLEQLFEEAIEWSAEVDLDYAAEWLRSTAGKLGKIIDRYRAQGVLATTKADVRR